MTDFLTTVALLAPVVSAYIYIIRLKQKLQAKGKVLIPRFRGFNDT